MTSKAKKAQFICPLRYKNELPELPFDPKLLDYPFDPEQHFRYRPTFLEKEEKEQMLTESTLGIPFTLIDPYGYFCSYDQRGVEKKEKKNNVLYLHFMYLNYLLYRKRIRFRRSIII